MFSFFVLILRNVPIIETLRTFALRISKKTWPFEFFHLKSKPLVFRVEMQEGGMDPLPFDMPLSTNDQKSSIHRSCILENHKQ